MARRCRYANDNKCQWSRTKIVLDDLLWAGEDLNLRRHTPTGLQPFPLATRAPTPYRMLIGA